MTWDYIYLFKNFFNSVILSFFTEKPPAILCPPPVSMIFFSTASIIKLPISKSLTDLHDALHTSIFSEITIEGLLNFSTNLLATIPITPGCQLSEFTHKTLALSST